MNTIQTTIIPLNEVESGHEPLDREALTECWNCGDVINYVTNKYGLVMLDNDPMVVAIDQNFYCARCGKHQVGFSRVKDENVIMEFENKSEADDAEYLLSMKGKAFTFKDWSEKRYNELIKKINDFKSGRDKNGIKRKNNDA